MYTWSPNDEIEISIDTSQALRNEIEVQMSKIEWPNSENERENGIKVLHVSKAKIVGIKHVI